QDSTVYYLCFYPSNAFRQQGTAASPTNYWLSVNAQTTAGSGTYFGWHSSFDFYNDVAVWGNAPFPAAWNPMHVLSGGPISLAFKINTETNQCPLIVNCSSNKTVECGSSWSFDPPTAFNTCCSTVTVSVVNTFTNGFCPRFVTRNWLISDCLGNTANCSQT